MSILDDAIREHLELKRAHGADEVELKRLEDEAFGPPGRPEEADPFAEAPTQFMTTEEPVDSAGAEEGGRRRINVADLQEPPPPEPADRGEAEPSVTAPELEEPKVETASAIEPEAEAPLAPAEDAAQAAPPAEEPPVADEAEAAGDERQAIAEQPTELFDIEAQLADEAPPAEAPSPSDEQIAEAELAEPMLAPPDPPTEIHASRTETPAAPLAEDEEDEEFWSEQRLSDELDQALEAPLTDEQDLAPLMEERDAAPPPDEPEAPAPGGKAPAPLRDAGEESEEPHVDYDPDTGHEDVLEDTPEFLEKSPEDDELWFEQKPPKDFDFDD